jgi:ribosomal protein S18 acetylase RimI-like enzyme
MRYGYELRELGAQQFTAELEDCLEVYAAAMDAPRIQLPGRRSIMEQHTAYPSFRAIEVRTSARPGRWHRHGHQVIAFAYGFHGARGQWWHDLVHSALAAIHGRPRADAWTADSFEIAEVHVHPDYQAHGIGHEMMLRLTAGRPERTSLLSTPDADTRARRLYRRLGFTDLLTGFSFAGAGPPYAVMGTMLPLLDGQPPARPGPEPGPPRSAGR